MLPDDYVRTVLARYDLPEGQGSPALGVAMELRKPLQAFGGKYLLGIEYIGSYAKGTRIRGATDIDLLVSLGPITPGSMDKIYELLFRRLKVSGCDPRSQNVSIRVTRRGVAADIVPAKQVWGASGDHQIFDTERKRITITNFTLHNKIVRESARLDEIRALKVWHSLRELRFPSFYLELVVIAALRGRPLNEPGGNVLWVLKHLCGRFADEVVVDPANPKNIVSDDLTQHERLAIARRAEESLAQPDWQRIIW